MRRCCRVAGLVGTQEAGRGLGLAVREVAWKFHYVVLSEKLFWGDILLLARGGGHGVWRRGLLVE